MPNRRLRCAPLFEIVFSASFVSTDCTFSHFVLATKLCLCRAQGEKSLMLKARRVCWLLVCARARVVSCGWIFVRSNEKRAVKRTIRCCWPAATHFTVKCKRKKKKNMVTTREYWIRYVFFSFLLYAGLFFRLQHSTKAVTNQPKMAVTTHGTRSM